MDLQCGWFCVCRSGLRFMERMRRDCTEQRRRAGPGRAKARCGTLRRELAPPLAPIPVPFPVLAVALPAWCLAPLVLAAPPSLQIVRMQESSAPLLMHPSTRANWQVAVTNISGFKWMSRH